MYIEGWRYYNHAAIPTTAPHENVNIEPVNNGTIWKIGGRRPLFVRWHSEWDCGYETNWWHVIKDTPFDAAVLNSKRRYEIKKGQKNFYVQKIDPEDYKTDLYEVTLAAFSAWPSKYRPDITFDHFKNSIADWKDKDVFGCYSISDNQLKGYAVLIDQGEYTDFSMLRTDPAFEKLGINAAIISRILEYYEDRFDGRFYIDDGSRNIRHETAFQNYLEKYFGFRKAYCILHIKYRNCFGLIVRVVYPFRKMINSDNKLGSLIFGVMKMEEIRRQKRINE